MTKTLVDPSKGEISTFAQTVDLLTPEAFDAIEERATDIRGFRDPHHVMQISINLIGMALFAAKAILDEKKYTMLSTSMVVKLMALFEHDAAANRCAMAAAKHSLDQLEKLGAPEGEKVH